MVWWWQSLNKTSKTNYKLTEGWRGISTYKTIQKIYFLPAVTFSDLRSCLRSPPSPGGLSFAVGKPDSGASVDPVVVQVCTELCSASRPAMQTRTFVVLHCLLLLLPRLSRAQDFFWLGNDGVFGGTAKASSEPDISLNQRNNNLDNNNNNNNNENNNVIQNDSTNEDNKDIDDGADMDDNNSMKEEDNNSGADRVDVSKANAGAGRPLGCDGGKNCRKNVLRNNQTRQQQRNRNQPGNYYSPKVCKP